MAIEILESVSADSEAKDTISGVISDIFLARTGLLNSIDTSCALSIVESRSSEIPWAKTDALVNVNTTAHIIIGRKKILVGIKSGIAVCFFTSEMHEFWAIWAEASDIGKEGDEHISLGINSEVSSLDIVFRELDSHCGVIGVIG